MSSTTIQDERPSIMNMKTITTLLMLAASLTFPVVGKAAMSPQPKLAPSPRKPTSTAIPMVDSYRIEYGYFVDQKDPEYKAPWNQIDNIPRVYTPADKAIQTPNSDTPYSFAGLDLRAEPIVLTMPTIEKERYFSIQLIDALHLQLRLHRQPHHRQRRRQLPDRRPGWKGEKPDGHQEGDSLARPSSSSPSTARSSSIRPTSTT